MSNIHEMAFLQQKVQELKDQGFFAELLAQRKEDIQ